MSKKTKFMRVGAALMVLALGTSCFVGGTLAKYTTSAKGSDSARVAKFGVEIIGPGDAFSETYKAATSVTDVNGKTIDYTVVSDVKVVAPGTSGTLAKFTITGKPEVAVNVAYKLEKDGETSLFSGKWYSKYESSAYSEDGYYPIIFTVETIKNSEATTAYFYVGKPVTTGENTEAITADNILDQINTYLTTVKASTNYPAGTDLAKSADVTAVTISWKWPFEGDKVTEIDGWSKIQTDTKDTVLGDYAASITDESSTDMPTITVKSSATVTQID